MTNSNSNSPYQGARVYYNSNTLSVNSSKTTIGLSSTGVLPASRIMSSDEYEFFTEAKNLITDMAQDEELSAGYRDQAKRMVVRLVRGKL